MAEPPRPYVSGWVQVPGWPTYHAHRDGKVRGPRGELKGTAQRGGLLRICLRAAPRARWCFIHTVVLETFVGPAPAGHEACHGNGDPTDNRLANLRWDTHSANMLDAVRHGTHNFLRTNQ